MCLIEHEAATRSGTGYKVYDKTPTCYRAKYGTQRFELGKTFVATTSFNEYDIDTQGYHICTKKEDAIRLKKLLNKRLPRLDNEGAETRVVVKVKYKQTLRRGYTRWFAHSLDMFKHRTVLAKEITLIEEVK